MLAKSHAAYTCDTYDIGILINISKINFPLPGSRLSNFKVLLGSTTLADAKANKGLTTCYQQAGAVADGATLTLACTTPGKARFVKVMLNGKNYLTLCEVEVYAVEGKLFLFISSVTHS